MCCTISLFRKLALVALLGFMSAGAALAQTGLATVTGIVSDESGGALPGVTVTATNQETNVPYVGVTNNAGNYVITGVPIGSYLVSVELTGFKGAQSRVTLSASQTARVDFKLVIGALEETVDVVATAAVLQTENAVVGRSVQREQVEAMPLQTRSLSTLTFFVPGSTTTDPRGDGGRPSVNGQRPQANSFVVDGIDSNESINNGIAYQPSPDAVEQVSVETLNYSAELGNVAGAVVNMVMKSGTNSYHGNGFWYWRDDKLASVPWATKRAGGKKAEFTRSIFGGTFGGPLVRDRLFFFGNYQGLDSENPPADTFATVVPDAWRRGDLSSLLAKNIVVRDPLTGLPFPNNQIPLSRFSSFARNLFANEALYPRANVARPMSDFRQNYMGIQSSSARTDQFDVKVDYNISAKDKTFIRYSQMNSTSATDQNVLPLQFSRGSNTDFWSLGFNWNRIIGSNIVNDLLAGVSSRNGYGEYLDPLGLGKLNNQFGIPGDQSLRGLTEIRWGADLTNIGNAETGTDNVTDVYQISERLTWVTGRHTLKFGGNWNYYRATSIYPGNNGAQGFISYSNFNFTGFSFADFLLDQVSLKGRGMLDAEWTQLQHRVAAYAADDFKLTDKITLNLGLRWAFTSPLVEKDDKQANFDLTNARQLLAGKDGNSRALYEPYYNGWEPRFGFAYRPGENWVIRGGYGISQYMEGSGANLRLPLNPPFFFESEMAYDKTSGAGTIVTGFEGLRALDVPSGQVRAWDPELRPQFTQMGNLFIEYLLGTRSSINVGYVGSKSTHLITPIDGNQPLAGEGDPAKWLPVQQRRPLYSFNPLLASISTTASKGRATYNALQSTFKQRLWNGLDFTANYTLSKALSNNRGFFGSSTVAADGAYPRDSRNIDLNYGPAWFDARHLFSLSGSYEMPFGRGRRFGNDWNRAVDAVAGGWSLSFSGTKRTGFPITVTDSAGRSLRAARSPEHPDRIGSGEVENPTLDHWIDRSAFASPALGQLGNSGVGILRMPGYWNVDLSIRKRFSTVGTHYILFVAEIFNAFNNVNYGPPQANIQSTAFGTITTGVGDPRIFQFVGKYYF
jgi:carboxypeptidase family protein/TonB-dependent receptor-like protein